MQYEIYTDGACSVNKRLGGYAAIAKFNGQQIVLHGNKKNATNNEMELLAVVQILHALRSILQKGDILLVHSDSAYIVNAINKKWLHKWQANDWKTNEGKAVKNIILWLTIYDYLIEFSNSKVKCEFVKVKGHSDCKLNNYVDRLAVKETELLKK